MKRIALIAIILMTTGLCLAQSDSAAPKSDTTKAQVRIEQTTNDSTTVTVTTEKGKTDSTTTVVIRSGREQRHHRPPRARWVVGLRANSITQLPGAIYISPIQDRRDDRAGF